MWASAGRSCYGSGMRAITNPLTLALLLGAVALGCGGSDEPAGEPVADDTSGEESPADAPVLGPPTAERPELTADECEASGGALVGDIGDGAIHRPDYLCPSGQPPTGRVSLGIEGSVCCPAAD